MDGAPAKSGMTRILVTGASGFIGKGLIGRLKKAGYEIRAAVRAPHDLQVETVIVGEIGPDTDWSRAFDDVTAIVHLAGLAHVMRTDSDVLADFRRINAAGTARLARQAEQAGVGRFVLISSIKAAADESGVRDIVESDTPAPRTPYGISKLEGERALKAAAHKMETVILRPPLVYGPGVRANFLSLLKLIDLDLPLPFGAVRNRRSLIARDNLVDAIAVSLAAPDAAGSTFYVSDGPPLSTPDLIRALANALGKNAALWPFPPRWLAGAASLTGKGEMAQSLLGSLAVDDSAFRAATGWTPPLTQEAAFADVGVWYRMAKARS
jgi:nucleoside-diphosphate-sugar epimerase